MKKGGKEGKEGKEEKGETFVQTKIRVRDHLKLVDLSRINHPTISLGTCEYGHCRNLTGMICFAIVWGK